jgi:tRNA(adenine34) deaminase
MRQALAAAARAPVHGDVPVGAVLLDEAGGVLAQAHNDREGSGDPTAHAEVLALRAGAAVRGSWRLSGLHARGHPRAVHDVRGCAGAVAGGPGGVRRRRPEGGAAGSLWDVLRDRRLNSRPEVVAGVLAEECGQVLRDFFAGQRDGLG